MSSIVKLNKGQLSAYASDLKSNGDKVSTEVSDLSSDLSSVKAHDKFSALKRYSGSLKMRLIICVFW